jgi:hypothetical protein
VPVRLAIALALGTLAGIRAWRTAHDPLDPPDFAQTWFAARALLHGRDPYALIGPGREFPFAFEFLYPLTAPVAILPLTLMDAAKACAVFAFCGAALLAWALMENGFAPLLGIFGAGMVIATQEAQWSPLLAAATIVPFASVFYVAKPTIGAAMLAARPTRWAVIGAVVLGLASVALQPRWPAEWLGIVTSPPAPGSRAPYYMPVALGAGPLLLLAALRWRRPEARLLLALSFAPQTVGLYESVPLLLVPRSWKESATVLALSHVLLWRLLALQRDPPPSRLFHAGVASVWLQYLPCLFMVLTRPNEGLLPEWLERRVSRWPSWIRGRTVTAT